MPAPGFTRSRLIAPIVGELATSEDLLWNASITAAGWIGMLDSTRVLLARGLSLRCSGYMLQDVATMSEIAGLALDLSEHERALLAANLLDSLPAMLSEADEGIAEALRRDADLDANPNEAITFEELESRIRHRRD